MYSKDILIGGVANWDKSNMEMSLKVVPNDAIDNSEEQS
jgi:hypothetical protein